MDQRSVFFEEWLRSLREQYKQVVRSGDRVTLPTLTAVMHKVGFGEEELAQLRVEATMHVDDVGADFTPDLDVLKDKVTVRTDSAERAQPHVTAPDTNPVEDEDQTPEDDPNLTVRESGQVNPAASLDDEALAEDAPPLTFEDGLISESVETEDDLLESEDASDMADDIEDRPQQMNLF